MNWDKIGYVFGLLLLVCLGIVIGSAGTLYYQYDNYQRTYNGLFFQANNITHSVALQTARGYDSGGNWVCVNVRGQSYSEAIRTINHEVAHEIFAVYCTDHIEQCINLTNGSVG